MYNLAFLFLNVELKHYNIQIFVHYPNHKVYDDLLTSNLKIAILNFFPFYPLQKNNLSLSNNIPWLTKHCIRSLHI